MFYVYILKCIDGSFYTGCSEDLNERINRHQKGYVDATKNKIPVVLVFFCAFVNKYKAFEFEKRKGAGVVERDGLENRCPALRDRGFESLSFRLSIANLFLIT